MEDKIVEILKQANKALSVYELNDALGFKTVEELKELLKVLNNLEDELKICRTKKDKYMFFKNSNLRIGNLGVNKRGFGFVRVEGEEDIFIAPDNLNNAINTDKVVVEIISKKGEPLEGRVVRIVKREFKEMVGEIYHKNKKCLVNLDDNKMKITIELDKKQASDLVDGYKVKIKVTNKLQGNNYRGELVEIIGHKDDPGTDILSIVAELGIHSKFPEEVLEELERIPNKVLESEMINRRDLRNETIFTIDGDDTKDIDDAISIKKIDNGYILGVHIADVSYYVRPGTKLDDEAYERGTSVYLADRVIPMLPHKLSNGICSLNPDEDRLAISCVMNIDMDGNIVDYDIFESVIRSRKQMTYKCVNQIFNNEQIPEGYEKYVEDLKQMQELAEILRKNKIKRGYIDFDLDEAKVIVDKDGIPTDIVLREIGIGQRLIEDFMIAANETVATHIYNMDLPFIYRVHGVPNEDKINEFIRFVSTLGYRVNTKIKDLTPKEMQKLLAELHDKKEFNIFSSMLLRSMQKAVYDSQNIGHFGLASSCYTHFTSPIRRYPDTTVHRLLRTYLFNNDYSNETIEYWERKLPVLGEHTSEMERLSIECERQVTNMKMAEYMKAHIGEEFEGIISSVTSFGAFVELPNLIEGLAKLDSFKGSSYYFDESTFSLISAKDKRGYRLGDNVVVKVIAASKEQKTIDFEIVKHFNKTEESSKVYKKVK